MPRRGELLMATDRAISAGPIHLDVRSVQQVVVHPQDENRFMMTAKEAAKACERAQNEKELREQFSEFLLYLRGWCERHAGRIRAAYVYSGDGFLNVLICTNGADYRFDFDDAVTQFDIDLTRQFDWLSAEVMQVPETAREGHISLEKAILVYGDGSGSRTESGS
jgi:hypothetical protein